LEKLVPNLFFGSKLSHVSLCSSCNIIMCRHISREAFAWSFFGQSFLHVSLLVVPIAQSHVHAFLEKVLFGLIFVKPSTIYTCIF
jgi:hypothetical protein